MKVNKADQPKVIALGILLTIIVIAIVVQFLTFQAPTDTQVAKVEPVPTTTQAPEPASPVEGFESIIPPSGPGTTNPNPFREVLVSRDPPRTTSIPVKQPPIKEFGPIPGPAEPGKDPGIEINNPPLPRLTGVLLGSRPLAVFELDGNSQMAGLGQRLPGGYVVRAITERGAELSFGKQIYRLRIDD